MRVLGIATALGNLALGAALVAAPAPFSKLKWDAVDSDGLRLVIQTGSHTLRLDSQEDYHLILSLFNQSQKARPVPPLSSFTDKIENCGGVHYIIRFPGGYVIDSWSGVTDWPASLPGDPPAHKKLIPFALPANGRASGRVYWGRVQSRDYFRREFEKHAGMFCLTAVIRGREVQSNTILYNGCPPPPRNYRPLDYIGWEPPERKIKRRPCVD